MAAPIDFSLLPRAEIADDGGRRLDAILCTTADVASAVRDAVTQGYAVMPAGGLTSAINSFDYDRARLAGRFRDVVAIRPKGALSPDMVSPDTAIETMLSHQLAIDRERATVTAGAGLTFEQVNAALAAEVAPNARVLVDLTSVGSASAGGVLATGGMGPLRLRPAATCTGLCIADGAQGPRLLNGAEVLGHQGMQGWTGMATAVRMRYFEVPPNEFGLVLPIQSSDIDGIADLMAHLHEWTEIRLPAEGNRLAGRRAPGTIVNGIELISRQALTQFVAQSSEPARSKAAILLQSCDYASADMLACLTGWSDQAVDDVLALLMDEGSETIGGIIIDYGVGFSSGTEMDTFRAIREGAPDLARTQARVTPPGKLKPWSTSTDINVAVPRDAAAIADLLGAYQDYRQAIGEIRAGCAPAGIEVHLSVYGHLSPHGTDPHHRVTLIAEPGADAALAEARTRVQAAKKDLIRALAATARTHGATITGGEKGVPSLVEIARAVGEAGLPDNLRDGLALARASLAQAPDGFAFRAPPELAP